MAGEPRIGVALLAAGASRRFGDADKLAQQFDGFMLGQNAAFAFPVERMHCAWVIVAAQGHPCEPGWQAMGFDPLVNPRAQEGMGTSVALAAQAAQQETLDALAIVLADMPLVPGSHYEALVDAVRGPEEIAVSAIGAARMPPAVFGSAHFAELALLSGDRGARDILARGRVIACPPAWLADVDTPDDLARHGQ